MSLSFIKQYRIELRNDKHRHAFQLLTIIWAYIVPVITSYKDYILITMKLFQLFNKEYKNFFKDVEKMQT